jgi:pantetheine-phosphate adenylyltransferase
MKEAIYAFSGDPITYGHIDIIQRALQIFDRVWVAIGVNPEKKYMFSLARRKELTAKALQIFGDKIVVDSFEGLLVDYAYRKNIKTVIRGVRSGKDSEFEREMFRVNLTQRGIEVVCLFAKPSLEHVSSSAVKDLQKNGGDLVGFVPLHVKQVLEHELSNYFLVGITGEIGAGKTHIAKALNWTNIEFDMIGRKLLSESIEPFAFNMRNELLRVIPFLEPSSRNMFIDPKQLCSIIFRDFGALQLYNHISKEPILCELRQQIRQAKGKTLINCALLAEAELTQICNNIVILVTATEEVRVARLKKRGYTDLEISSRISAQLSAEKKKEMIDFYIEQDNFGKVITVVNDEQDTAALLCKINSEVDSLIARMI